MRDSARMIRVCIVLSALGFIVAYLANLNMSLGFLRVGSPWISNDFVCSLAIGIFTGGLVALFVEVPRYLNIKKLAERQITAYAGHILESSRILNGVLDGIACDVTRCPGNLAECSGGAIDASVRSIVYVDYCTLFGYSNKQKVYSNIAGVMVLDAVAASLRKVQIAVNEQYLAKGSINPEPAGLDVLEAINASKELLERLVSENEDLLGAFQADA